MTILHPFLAQDLIPTDVLPGSWHWMGLTLKELLILLGAVGAVTALVLIWAVYFRKKPHRHGHHHHHHHHQPSADSPEPTEASMDSGSGVSDGKRYRRKRRRRREHRPRNPTLAETGGLPPLRAERPPDPLP